MVEGERTVGRRKVPRPAVKRWRLCFTGAYGVVGVFVADVCRWFQEGHVVGRADLRWARRRFVVER